MPDQGRILVLDDEPNNLIILQEILEPYELVTARTGAECLELYESFKPDLMLLDIMVGDISGLEICRQIRTLPSSARTKIILVSGRTELEDRLEGYAAGADDYVAKPFYEDELLAKVRVFLRLTYAEQALADLTQHLQREVMVRSAQLIKAEKLAFIGMKTAELIHNIQNPLTVINGYAGHLQKQFPDNQKVEKLKAAVNNLKMQIKEYLAHTSMESTVDSRPLDLNQILNAELEYLGTDELQQRRIHLVTELGPLPLFAGVAVHFAHCFGNIIKNAVDAMYGQENPSLVIRSRLKEPKTIRIEFKDSGPGIPEQIRSKVFEPLFTTKAQASEDPNQPQGSGLGLAFCKEMIESYGGTIEIAATSDAGTTFVIELPEAHAPQAVTLP